MSKPTKPKGLSKAACMKLLKNLKFHHKYYMDAGFVPNAITLETFIDQLTAAMEKEGLL